MMRESRRTVKQFLACSFAYVLQLSNVTDSFRLSEQTRHLMASSYDSRSLYLHMNARLLFGKPNK